MKAGDKIVMQTSTSYWAKGDRAVILGVADNHFDEPNKFIEARFRYNERWYVKPEDFNIIQEECKRYMGNASREFRTCNNCTSTCKKRIQNVMQTCDKHDTKQYKEPIRDRLDRASKMVVLQARVNAA